MKKLISIFLIFNLCFCLFAETIQINTSKGTTDLVVPETQEELREAFIEMSKLYVEERYAYEDLTEAFKEVQVDFESLKESIKLKDESINKYIADNELLRNQYNTLTTDYNSLIESMNKRNRIRPIKGIVGVELGFENLENEMTLMPAVELGVYLFEKVTIKSRISYPWEIGLGVGFTF